MAGKSEVLLILDDWNTGAFKLGGGDWTYSAEPGWYGGTSPYPAFAMGANGDTGNYGTLSISFTGTAIAFWGNTPPAANSQSVSVKIDNGGSSDSSFNDPSPQSYRQWYKTPTLSEGSHTVSLSRIAGASMDFAIITAGQNTPLNGMKIIVDDTDSSISYDSKWNQNSDLFQPGRIPHGTPFGGSTHLTKSSGASATFKFTGTSVAVYGIFSWVNLGTMAASFSIDGSSSSQTYAVNSDSPEHVKEPGQQQNFLLFSADSLSSGDHTLVITVTRADQAFMLDYITYTPSFSTLASISSGSSGVGSSGGSSGGSSVGSTPGTTVQPGSSSPSNSASPPSGSSALASFGNSASLLPFSAPNTVAGSGASSTPHASSTGTPGSSGGTSQNNASQTSATADSAPIGAIVGGALGGAALLLLVLMALWWRRHQTRKLDMERALLGTTAANATMDGSRSPPMSTRSTDGTGSLTPFNVGSSPSPYQYGSATIPELKRMRAEADAAAQVRYQTITPIDESVTSRSHSLSDDLRPNRHTRMLSQSQSVITSTPAPPAYDYATRP